MPSQPGCALHVVLLGSILQVINDELGAPWYEIYADLTPEPIAAASLGQVYRGRLKTGEEVAVKVQRPGVLVSGRCLGAVGSVDDSHQCVPPAQCAQCA